MRLEPTASRSQVKHFTTEPLRSHIQYSMVCFRNYAESIDARLRLAALISDIIVIPEDMSVPQMVEDAQKKNCLFAIIINSQNETHKSLILNILHGTPQGKQFIFLCIHTG